MSSGADPQEDAGMRCGGWVSILGKVELQRRVACGTLSFLSGPRYNGMFP